MEKIEFGYALSLVNTLYGIDMTDRALAEEIGLVAFNLIGNHHTNLIRIVVTVPENRLIDLPCHITAIESITTPGEDFINSSNIKTNPSSTLLIEEYIEPEVAAKYGSLYQSGSLVSYREEGNQIYIADPVLCVSILYHQEILDESGLPYLSEREAQAIAAYIAYTMLWRQGMRSQGKQEFQIAQGIYVKWLELCRRARVSGYISQNDVDKVLSASTNWNRKVYGLSYKPTRR